METDGSERKFYLEATGFEDPARGDLYEIDIDDRDGVTVYSECCASSMSLGVARKVHEALGRYLVEQDPESRPFHAGPPDGLAGDVRDWVKWHANTEWMKPRPSVPPMPDLTAMTDALKRMYAEWLNEPREVRVGGGPAWAWLKNELDKLTTYPSSAPMPDSRAAAMIWGLPVILDPNIPGDEIRIGSVRYIIGHDDHLFVKAGQIVQVAD